MHCLAIKYFLTSRKMSIHTLMEEMRPVVWRTKGLILREKLKLLHLLATSVLNVLDVRNISQGQHFEWCSTNVIMLIRNWMWEIQPVVLKRVHFDYQDESDENAFLMFSAYQVCIARKQKQKVTFPYVLASVLKNCVIPCWTNCSHWFLKEAGLFFWENQSTSTFGSIGA